MITFVFIILKDSNFVLVREVMSNKQHIQHVKICYIEVLSFAFVQIKRQFCFAFVVVEIND